MHPILPFLALGLAAAAVIDTEGLPNTDLDTSSWTNGTAPPIDDLVNLHDIQIAAKNTLSARNYAYYRTAALDEVTYQANLFNWAKIRLNGFSFQDTSNVSLKTSMLGYDFDSPFVRCKRMLTRLVRLLTHIPTVHCTSGTSWPSR